MHTAFIVGTGHTAFGRHEGRGALALMADAARLALADAALEHAAIDGLLCGYATTLPHLMLSTLFAEGFGLRPAVAHSVQLGGATGAAMIMQAADLVRAGRCQRVLVVAGENRLSGQTRDSSIQTLAQVGHPQHELPNGTSVPAYYALLASRYLHETGTTEADLAELAVLMRQHAATHPGAHLRTPITVAEVMASKPVATPLKLLDCCPISDGAVALVVSRDAGGGARVALLGAGQAHQHQHLTALASVMDSGAAAAARRALIESGLALAQIGLAPRGGAAAQAREGRFARHGPLPLNTHGGLLSFGHSGVAGGMAHAVEAARQLAGRAGERQVPRATHALVHADGGVLSSHVSLVLSREE